MKRTSFDRESPIFVFVEGAAVALGACAHHSADRTNFVGATSTTDASYAAASRASGSPIVVAPSILDACRIDSPPPFVGFDFDSAALGAGSDALLAKLALCIAPGGPLADARLRVTGYADQLGASSYNDQLGDYRAVALRRALAARGIATDRIEVQSAGEEDATGATRAERRQDRRVELDVIRGPEP